MTLKITRWLFALITMALIPSIAFAQPSNDECTAATIVTLGIATCGPTVSADNTNATGIAGDVCGQSSTFFGGGDIWFSFLAGGSVAFLDLISEPGGGPAASMYISVYDNCNGNCVYDNNSISTTSVEVITGLTAGQTYLIRMYDLGNNDFGPFEFCMFDPGPAPVNDECANATVVTLGTGTCGPTIMATNAFATGVAGDVCGSTSTLWGDGDIWFSFVAGGTSAFLDLISEPGGGTAASMFISVYDGCNGNCVYNNNSIVTTAVEIITGLTVGDTYLIRMYELNNDDTGSFEFCMFDPAPPPVNDECSGAISVTLGTGSCGPTVIADNAFATGIAGDVCGSTSTLFGDGDIWFSFVAGSNEAFLNLLSEPGGNTSADVFISVYDGCGGNCVYNNNNITTTDTENITGLTAGNTYYIRMYESGNNVFGEFEFCMFDPGPPPANDDCIGATPVTMGTGSCGPPVIASNMFATGIAGDVCGSGSTLYGDGDIWFSFVAGGDEAFLTLLSEPGSGTAASMYISVYDLCNGNCVYNNNAILTTATEIISGLTAGNTYYIRMYEQGNNVFGSFEFCMFDPGPPPANDDCAGSIAVTLGSNSCGPTIFSDNTFATGTAGDVCGSTSSLFGDGDLWYSFIAGAETVYFDMTVEVGSQYLSVYDACGGSCVYNNNSLATFSDEVISGLTVGNTYYIRLYELSNNNFGVSAFCMYYLQALPIKLKSFIAKADIRHNVIEWTTSSEVNVQDHTLMKSNDAANWEVLSVQSGETNSSSDIEYDMMDINPYSTTYYQLTTTDIDGTNSYSPIVRVSRDSERSSAFLGASPVPTIDVINLNVYSSQNDNISITLTDISGKILLVENRNISIGDHQLPLDLSNFNNGVYMVTVSSNYIQQTLRIIKN